MLELNLNRLLESLEPNPKNVRAEPGHRLTDKQHTMQDVNVLFCSDFMEEMVQLPSDFLIRSW